MEARNLELKQRGKTASKRNNSPVKESKESSSLNSDMKKSIECGQMLISFLNADIDEVRGILYRATKPFREKLPANFSKENISFPDDYFSAKAELDEIIKKLKTRENLSNNEHIKSYFKSYNVFFIEKSAKKSCPYKHALSWKYIIAYNLVHFMRLNDYAKYIRECECCGQYYISEKKPDYRVINN